MALGLVPLAIGLACLFFPRVIQRHNLDMNKNDPFFDKHFRSSHESEGYVFMVQVMGVVGIFFGVLLLLCPK